MSRCGLTTWSDIRAGVYEPIRGKGTVQADVPWRIPSEGKDSVAIVDRPESCHGSLNLGEIGIALSLSSHGEVALVRD